MATNLSFNKPGHKLIVVFDLSVTKQFVYPVPTWKTRVEGYSAEDWISENTGHSLSEISWMEAETLEIKFYDKLTDEDDTDESYLD